MSVAVDVVGVVGVVSGGVVVVGGVDGCGSDVVIGVGGVVGGVGGVVVVISGVWCWCLCHLW